MKGGFPSTDAPMRAVRRILLAQLDQAIAGLKRRNRTARTVHEVRVELKRARATLRLLRECIGVIAYRRENTSMRDAARPLTAVRDANVLLETLRRLEPAALAKPRPARQEQARHAQAGQKADFVQHLYRALRRERRDIQQRLRPRDLAASAAALAAVRRRLQSVPGSRLEQATLGAGVKCAYISGRRAFARVRRRPTDESLHEWRKQTKYLANQLEILLPLSPKRLAKSCSRSSRLAERLGADHDLALLSYRISHYATGPNAASQNDSVAELIRRLARQRKVLQSKAYRLGRRLYCAKPGRLAATVDAGLRAAAADARSR